jgi:hypothetical protein
MSGSEAFVLVQACADEIITVIAMQSVDEKQRWVAEFEKVDVCMQGDIGGDSRLRLIKDFSRSSSSTIRLEATHSESKSDGISSIDSAPSLHQSSRSIN